MRAELENEIGLFRPAEVRRKTQWIADILGESVHNVDHRSRVYSLGSAADPLWEELEGPMTLSTALKICQTSKINAHKFRIPLERALGAILEEYMGFEAFRFLEGGKVVRVPSPAQKKRMARVRVTRLPAPVPEADAEEDAQYEPEEEEAAPISIPLLTATTDETNFWRGLRAMVSGYIDQRLTDFDGIEKASIKRDIEAELGVVIESLRSKTHLRQSRRKTRISFPEVEQACSVLAMDPPPRGSLPDLEIAKKKKRLMAREYHPDSAGNDAKSGQLKVVIEAYNLLEAFVAQMNYSESQGANRSNVQTKGRTRGDSHD